MSQAKPRQLFAELRQKIVRNEANNSSQDVQDEAEGRLGMKKKKKKKLLFRFTNQYLQDYSLLQLTCRAMNTVLALMAKVMTAIRGHMTRSEWRISFCKDKESTPLFRSCRSSVWFSKCSINEDIYIFTTVEFVVDFEETNLIKSSDEKYHTYINDNDVTLCIFYATCINISIFNVLIYWC